MGEVRYMISEAAKKLQVESHVLRYWEDELGLEIGRTDMGHRCYTEDDIQLFLCIQKLKNEGMLLRDLKFMIPELTAARKRLNAARAEDAEEGAEKEAAEGGEGGSSKAEANKAYGVHTSDAGGKTSGMQADGPGSKADEAGSKAIRAGSKAIGAGSKAIGAGSKSDDIQAAKADSRTNDIRSDGTDSRTDDIRSDGTDRAADCMQGSASLASAHPAAPEADVIQVTQLEQVRSLIGDVLTDVVSANNETLKKDISRKVTSDVIREMDFLFQANERREEEHYRKLDVLIRQQQAGRREAARETPLGKLKKLLT
ncbi:MAG: MerR family transcriptional regulator [Ruminococcus sp.]|jgi:DNA-binding transcriptional MerR regulator|nr:MerR family transcriptional regulator [Ruminococcus sp.]